MAAEIIWINLRTRWWRKTHPQMFIWQVTCYHGHFYSLIPSSPVLLPSIHQIQLQSLLWKSCCTPATTGGCSLCELLQEVSDRVTAPPASGWQGWCDMASPKSSFYIQTLLREMPEQSLFCSVFTDMFCHKKAQGFEGLVFGHVTPQS